MGKHHKHTRREFLGRFSMGCAALSLTPLYSGIVNMGLMNAAAASNRPTFAPATSGYKALVCVMLSGGNDSFNMLVPRDTTRYNEYATARTNIALPQANLLPINPTNVTSGEQYGIHPNLTKIQTLFENQKAAFVTNIGALVEPTTLQQFRNKQNLPLGLFSHSDQKKHWQTSVPQDKNALGWGGRLADILYQNNSNQNISMNISLQGINFFQKGNTIREYAISHRNNGSVLINGSTNTGFYQTVKRQTLDSLLDQSYNNLLEQAYANTINQSNGNSISFDAAIAASQADGSSQKITVNFDADNFSQKMYMVAKTIASRNILNVSNQTFFVELGGFDTHNTFLEDYEGLMTKLDNAIGSFYDAMAQLGLENSVTTFTMSDFARKLVSNGDGADHAWGGNTLVVGGAVNGKKIYGQFPSLYIGNPLDTGKGRLIPTTSCDEYFAELALWFGASSSDLNQILPNINNFWTPTTGGHPIGFMQ